ncbi:hypothetical protein QQX98_002687 [Neonectria punicea]|uniref:Uncharacterized protein n=1 Tax=Neonectria punicea TaxID=979145 RepID=A0ABR1HH69_9HYPO
MEEGGHVDIDGDGCWWAHSGKELYCDPSAAEKSLSAEIEQARRSFYTPILYIDPFGNAASADLDQFWLLPVRSIDAVGNKALATNNYRHMQAASMTDANGNRTEVGFDSLGKVAAVACMGKPSDSVGDSLIGVEVDIADDSVAAFVANPTREAAESFLGNSTRRSLRCQQMMAVPGTTECVPTFEIELARTEHITTKPSADENQTKSMMQGASPWA